MMPTVPTLLAEWAEIRAVATVVGVSHDTTNDVGGDGACEA